MQKSWEITGGSVPGRGHVGRGPHLAGRNNQDVYGWRRAPGATVAVVCDGCSAGRWSELGARIGLSLLLEAFGRRLETPPAELDQLLDEVSRELLDGLGAVVEQMGGVRPEIIHDGFLFTVVGVLITADDAAVFAQGDGLFALDGEIGRLGPFDDNAPPYLGRALLPDEAPRRLELVARRPASSLSSAMIATDGAVDLMEAAGEPLPGRAELVGPLSQIWTEGRYFRNADALRRRLALINSEVPRPAPGGGLRWHRGHLPDDTTVVTLRRGGRVGGER